MWFVALDLDCILRLVLAVWLFYQCENVLKFLDVDSFNRAISLVHENSILSSSR